MKGPLFADEENTKLVAGKAVMKLALPSASWDACTILSGIVIFLEIADYISVHYFFFFFLSEWESTEYAKSNSAIHGLFIDTSGFYQPGVCSLGCQNFSLTNVNDCYVREYCKNIHWDCFQFFHRELRQMRGQVCKDACGRRCRLELLPGAFKIM